MKNLKTIKTEEEYEKAIILLESVFDAKHNGKRNFRNPLLIGARI
jgi:hypothetical protein